MGSASASMTTLTPLAAASWSAASAKPSLRSMHADAARFLASSNPVRMRGSGKRYRLTHVSAPVGTAAREGDSTGVCRPAPPVAATFGDEVLARVIWGPPAAAPHD